MDLFLCFDIFKQLFYPAKCFVNTYNTYKYAKSKTLSLQTAHFIKRKLNKISHESKNSSVGEPDVTFRCEQVIYVLQTIL